MSDAQAIESRLRELADRLEICELTARYNHSFDAGDPDAFANTFTADGVLATGGMPKVGHEALKASCRLFDRRVRHMTSDFIIEIDGDTARQTCTLAAYRRSHDGSVNELALTGQYADELERTPVGWRFVRRECIVDRATSPFGDIHAVDKRTTLAGEAFGRFGLPGEALIPDRVRAQASRYLFAVLDEHRLDHSRRSGP